MAKLTRKQLEAIVKKEAPGYHIARQSGAADAREAQVKADEITPDLEQLKKKYGGGESASGASDAAPRKATKSTRKSARKSTAATSDGAQIVALESDRPADPWDRGSRPKSIVISDSGRVIGRQG